MKTSDVSSLELLLSDLHLSPEEQILVRPLLEEKNLQEKVPLIQEATPNLCLYFVTEGELAITKETTRGQPQVLSNVTAPIVLGEVSALLHELPVATVVPLKNGKYYSLNTTHFQGQQWEGIEKKLQQFASRALAKKIQSSNQKLIDELQIKVAHLEEKKRQAIFLTQIFIGLALYLFALNLFKAINHILPADTVISGAVILGFSGALYYALKKSGAPLKLYGIHTENWKKNVSQSVIWTLPLLLLALILKGLWVKYDSSGTVHWFQPESIFKTAGDFAWWKWGVAVSAYSILSIAQELIGRSGIQSTLRFLFQPLNGTQDPSAEARAIWVSSLLFSATHTHLGGTFAAITILPGLFWAWMYSRQNSIIGPALSHIVLGVFVVFILGIPVS